MNTKDWLLFDLAGLMIAYRNAPEFQQRAIEIADTLLQFLQQRNLLVDPTKIQNPTVTQDLKIYSSDLTQLGVKICIGRGNALSRWLNSMSIITRKLNVNILERELARLKQG